MLRITARHLPDRFVLKLEGRLTTPWVGEADACWRAAIAGDRTDPIEIDLLDLCSIDDAGRELLVRMHRAGAGLLVRGCAMRELVREIAISSARGLTVPEGRST